MINLSALANANPKCKLQALETASITLSDQVPCFSRFMAYSQRVKQVIPTNGVSKLGSLSISSNALPGRETELLPDMGLAHALDIIAYLLVGPIPDQKRVSMHTMYGREVAS